MSLLKTSRSHHHKPVLISAGRCSAEEESCRLSGENGRERSHIDTLERQLAALRTRLDEQREQAAEAARRQQDASRTLELELTGRLNRSRAQFEAACRDKDKMVLRYAQSEKSVIDAKREAVTADRRVKEAVREKEMLVSKVNHMVQERNRISQQLESKVRGSGYGLTLGRGGVMCLIPGS